MFVAVGKNDYASTENGISVTIKDGESVFSIEGRNDAISKVKYVNDTAIVEDIDTAHYGRAYSELIRLCDLYKSKMQFRGLPYFTVPYEVPIEIASSVTYFTYSQHLHQNACVVKDNITVQTMMSGNEPAAYRLWIQYVTDDETNIVLPSFAYEVLVSYTKALKDMIITVDNAYDVVDDVYYLKSSIVAYFNSLC